MPDDNDAVEYALGVTDDKTIYQATVRCDQTLTEQEFAGCLISLGQDILTGKINLSDFVDVIDHAAVQDLN